MRRLNIVVGCTPAENRTRSKTNSTSTSNRRNASSIPGDLVPDCIVETNCGLLRNAIPFSLPGESAGGFEELEKGIQQSRTILGLENHKTYFVNIAMVYPNGMPAAYVGAQGKLE